MPISFIAVQCFECSTMQVKQQKKSSNKWSCVVCNQKQSVRKVFAQSFMAKDVRKFVQNFNLSRQISDQQQSLSNDEPRIAVDSPGDGEEKRKRNDWTEYIDNDDREEYSPKFEQGMNSAQGDDGFEPMVVTEMPKATFSKPKVRNYSCRGQKLLKPSFSNRRASQRQQNGNSQDLEGDSNIKSKDLFHDCNIKAKDEGLDLKWNSFMAQIRETRDLATREKPAHQKIAGNNTVSKWSSFMTAEDDDSSDDDQKVESRKKREGDHISQLWMNDERVEEDVHPDFL